MCLAALSNREKTLAVSLGRGKVRRSFLSFLSSLADSRVEGLSRGESEADDDDDELLLKKKEEEEHENVVYSLQKSAFLSPSNSFFAVAFPLVCQSRRV